MEITEITTECKDTDLGLEDSGVGSSCSSSVSDAQSEPLDCDGDDARSATLDSDDEDDDALPFMQVSIYFNFNLRFVYFHFRYSDPSSFYPKNKKLWFAIQDSSLLLLCWMMSLRFRFDIFSKYINIFF